MSHSPQAPGISIQLAFIALAIIATTSGCLTDAASSGVPPNKDDIVSRTSALGQCSHSTSRNDRVGDGFWMYTYLSYQPTTGLLQGRTVLSTSRSFAGFVGGVIAILVDAQGIPVYATELHRWGIGACGFSCPNSRTIDWSDYVPEYVWPYVAGVSIQQAHAADDRALFKSLTFVHDGAEACASLAAYYGYDELALACEGAALTVAKADSVLTAAVAGNVDGVVAEMMSAARDESIMFTECPPPPPPPPPPAPAPLPLCHEGELGGCPDHTGNYRVCTNGAWGRCIM
jgi:hypothetical protein